MADERKMEMNGLNNPVANSREENSVPRGGGRRPNRFGPRGQPRNQERQNDQNNGDNDQLMDDGDANRRRRFPPGRGGRGGFGSGFGGMNKDRDDGGRGRHEDRVFDKLATMSGNTYDLAAKDNSEQKFSSRCRLYVGNFADVTEDEVKEMFKPFGEVSECYVQPEKMFAFVRLDYRTNAERAKRELDGSMRKNKLLKVRFAPVGAAIKVKNLTQWVTNELLEYAFSVFGEIESAKVLVDERGNSLKEGIVEFARKPYALAALKRCTEGCFFLTSSIRPVIVEPYDVIDDVDGFPEKSITRKPTDYIKCREIGPRFAKHNSFEFEYGTRWKQMYEVFKQKEETLKRELKLEEEKLEAQMEYAKFEHETEMLREQLKQREMDRERQKMEWEMKTQQADEQRRMEEERFRANTHEMGLKMQSAEEDLRRRQRENMSFLQSHGGGGAGDAERRPPPREGNMPNIPGEPSNARPSRFEGEEQMQQRHGPPHPFRRGGGRWAQGRPQEDFPANKRPRRF